MLSIRVIPNSKKVEIMKIDENSYRIKLDAPTTKGKANARLIEVLSDYFNVKKSSVTIVKGHKSREKLIIIEQK